MHSVLIVTALKVAFLSVFVCYCTCDDPLILTSLLKSGKYLEAQRLAKVQPSIGEFVSYAGFFELENRCDSKVFFWYLPAQERNPIDATTILWQQGGPGSSSLFGLMKEIGPLRYRNSSGLTKVESHWNKENNLLVIEGAVTGFSFGKKNCSPEHEDEMGEELYQGLIQFYTMFPQMKGLPLLPAAQSYGPKITAALARIILKRNPTAEIKMNLTALIMVSAFFDPPKQQMYGTYLENIGLIDGYQRALYEEQQRKYLKAVQEQRWWNASDDCYALRVFLFIDTVGYDIDNQDFSPTEPDQNDWVYFVQLQETRKALHVGNLDFFLYNDDLYYRTLYPRLCQSVTPWIEDLLNSKVPIVFINGQRDIICAHSWLEPVLKELNWEGKELYSNATRSQWCVENTQAGYIKSASLLYEVLVLKAGHAVPMNQPKFVAEILSSITSGTPDNLFHKLETC